MLALLQPASASAAFNCGTIQLAKSTDATTDLLASIDKLILNGGFDCSIENFFTDDAMIALTNSTRPAFASAVAVNNTNWPQRSSTGSGPLRTVNENAISGAGQSWWISPEAVEKHPELKTVLDVLEHPELFTMADNKNQGAFVGCPANSDCQLINANLFRAFEMENKGWRLVTPDSPSNLDYMIDNAITNNRNWFGSYRAPSAITGRHNLVKLEFGIEFAGVKNWDGCITKPVAQCNDPMPTAWNPAPLHTIATDSLNAVVPSEVIDYLSTRVFPADVISSLLALQNDMHFNALETASVFLHQNTDIWKPWVSSTIADKVIDSLPAIH